MYIQFEIHHPKLMTCSHMIIILITVQSPLTISFHSTVRSCTSFVYHYNNISLTILPCSHQFILNVGVQNSEPPIWQCLNTQCQVSRFLPCTPPLPLVTVMGMTRLLMHPIIGRTLTLIAIARWHHRYHHPQDHRQSRHAGLS